MGGPDVPAHIPFPRTATVMPFGCEVIPSAIDARHSLKTLPAAGLGEARMQHQQAHQWRNEC